MYILISFIFQTFWKKRSSNWYVSTCFSTTKKFLKELNFFFLSIHIWNELKNWRFWWVYLKHDISNFIFKNMCKAWTDLSKNLSIFKLFIYKCTQVFLRPSFRIDLHAWKAISICRVFFTYSETIFFLYGNQESDLNMY